jgi:RND family efflux transporter MFP subunit
MNTLKKTVRFVRKPWFMIIILIILGGIFFLMRGGSAQITDTIVVTRGSVSESVSVTGKVKPVQVADLGFERGGKVGAIHFNVGDKVSKGNVIVELVNDDLDAALRAQEAQLAELVRGTRAEDLDVESSRVDSAKITLSNSEESLVSTIKQAYVSLDDAIRNKTDEVFNNGSSVNPDFKYRIDSSNSSIPVDKTRLAVEDALNSWQKNIAIFSGDDATTLVAQSENTLKIAKDLLGYVAVLVNDLDSSTVPQVTLDKYKTDISNARSTVNNALSSVLAARDAWTSASSALVVAEKSLTLKLSGSTSEAIDAQRAHVDQARAELNKTKIVAPFTGTLARQDAILGEIASANARVATVINDSKYEIEANVPEVDIGRIALGNVTSITLDAFPGKTWNGNVSYIEPSETIVDGVVNFKIKVVFDPGMKIQSGLTANLDIEARKSNNVLVIPRTAVLETDSGATVKKVVNGKTVDTPVVLGLRGADGKVEIISGLSEGDILAPVAFKAK